MSTILHIESATRVCSVALSKNGQLLVLRETHETDYAHSRLLTVYISEVMEQAGVDLPGLSAVAVSQGPGSYTGLRIGVSAAKGICYGLDIPLIAVDTMEAMTYQCRDYLRSQPDFVSPESLEAYYCPMIDARRMEVYHALYNHRMECRQPVRAAIIEQDTFRSLLEEHKVLFFGDGAAKCQSLINSPNALFLKDVLPSAKGMLIPAQRKFDERTFEDTAYFEPFYLKDFVAGKPRVKGLHG